MMKVPHNDENLSLIWKLFIVMKIHHKGDTLLVWWNLISVIKIHHYHVNESLWWKIIIVYHCDKFTSQWLMSIIVKIFHDSVELSS